MTVPPVTGGTPTRLEGPSPRSRSGAAEGFEKLLLTQLTKTLVDSAMGEQAGPHAALLPEALADGLAAGGGIGIAKAFDDTLPRP